MLCHGCLHLRPCVGVQVKRALKGKADWQTMWGHTLYHIEDVPYKADMSDLPDTFTPARHKVTVPARLVSACFATTCFQSSQAQGDCTYMFIICMLLICMLSNCMLSNCMLSNCMLSNSLATWALVACVLTLMYSGPSLDKFLCSSNMRAEQHVEWSPNGHRLVTDWSQLVAASRHGVK